MNGAERAPGAGAAPPAGAAHPNALFEPDPADLAALSGGTVVSCV